MKDDLVIVTYINHKGETVVRRIRPIRIYFGKTFYHPTPQWLMEVFDLEKSETRDYAMSGFRGWNGVTQ